MAKAKVEFVEATQEHIDGMKGNLREADKRSCYAAMRRTADECLQKAFDTASMCWVVLVDGIPTACWGVVENKTVLVSSGFVWLFATDGIGEISYRAARHSKRFVKKMLEKFGYLETWVDTRNKLSLGWLSWCGFKAGRERAVGSDNVLFRRLCIGMEGS